MIERGWGRLILVTSIVADLATPGASSYTAAKGGLSALARALAAELGATGITSNALSPGFFATETNSRYLASPAGSGKRQRLPGQALGRAARDRRRGALPRLDRPPPTSTATRSPSTAACRQRTSPDAGLSIRRATC
jgi:gluconate 5-dehydrogenase